VQPRLILLDADGVLWRGGEVIPQAPGFIRRAHRAGIRCVLITNNAGLDRSACADKCRRLGLDLGEGDIYSTNYLAGPYVAQHYPGARVLVVGSPLLVRSTVAHCNVTDAHSWLTERGLAGWLERPEQLAVLEAADFDVVLMGIDINIDYATLALAGVACARGAQLVAANDDLTFPFEGGLTLPGNGSCVGLVAAVSGASPERIGKPEPPLLELIAQETGIGYGEMALVGDRVETDIVMAQRAGIPAFLVLTGVTSAETAPVGAEGVIVAATLDDVAAALGL
jgi:HAD superfamily hydrolase (TIGR01450 family)